MRISLSLVSAGLQQFFNQVFNTMSAASGPCAPVIVTDLTVCEYGDIDLWIRTGKQYHNVPNYVSNELCRQMTALPLVIPLLPPPSLPVLSLLKFPVPPIAKTIKVVNPGDFFSFDSAMHTSSECVQLPCPSRETLNAMRASAGQAMLDDKVSILHWEKSSIFLPFDALGTWALIEANTSKRAWGNALRWMDEQHRNIQEQSISQVTALLHTIPWKDYIRGLGSCLV